MPQPVMQASVPAAIHARLSLYGEIFELCRAGGFSFPRFLALVPDRLRLATVDAHGRARIPVVIPPEVPAAFERCFPETVPARAANDLETQKRILRFAQLDPELDVARLGGWIAGDADTLLSMLSRLYTKGMNEIGAGPSGEQLAYLAHCAVLEALSSSIDSLPDRVLASSMIELALASVDSRRASARLGLQLAATTSPIALGADADALAVRPLNVYRTTEVAYQLARRVIIDPVEEIELEAVVRVIADRLMLDDAAQSILARDTLLDLIHDAASLMVVQNPQAELGPIHELSRNFSVLLQTVLNAHRRAAMIRMLEGPSKVAHALAGLLGGAERVLRGDTSGLGVHGDLEPRARTAAAGAIALVLDARAELERRASARAIDHLRPEVYAEGLAYRFAVDDRPLYRLPRRANEALVSVKMSAVVHRAVARGARLAASSLARELYEPILEAQRIAGDAALALIAASAESFSFAGDVVLAIELAERLCALDLDLSIYVTFGEAVQDVALSGGPKLALYGALEELSRGTETFAGRCICSIAALAAFHNARREVIELAEHRFGAARWKVARGASDRSVRHLFRYSGELELTAGRAEAWELVPAASKDGRAVLDLLSSRLA